MDRRVKISLVHKYSPNYPVWETAYELFDFHKTLPGLLLSQMDSLKPTQEDGSVRKVLAQYGGEIAARNVFFRGIRGGFSGSRVFALNLDSGASYFLKQWPEAGPSHSRLSEIHLLLAKLSELRRNHTGFAVPCVPSPIANLLGQTITVQDCKLWDLTPRIPGAPKEPSEPTQVDIRDAMQTIAQLHLAMNWLSASSQSESSPIRNLGPSPGLLSRRSKIQAIVKEWRDCAVSLKKAPIASKLRTKCDALFNYALPLVHELHQDATWDRFQLPLQPCLRDLWYAHVLFDGSQVSGIIDFGSIRSDCVVTDLARLLRSWYTNDEADFREPLDDYHAIRRLSTVEREAFPWFDRTSRVLSAFQWIEWLAIERREFEDWEAVSARLDFVLARLPKRSRGVSDS